MKRASGTGIKRQTTMGTLGRDPVSHYSGTWCDGAILRSGPACANVAGQRQTLAAAHRARTERRQGNPPCIRPIEHGSFARQTRLESELGTLQRSRLKLLQPSISVHHRTSKPPHLRLRTAGRGLHSPARPPIMAIMALDHSHSLWWPMSRWRGDTRQRSGPRLR